MWGLCVCVCVCVCVCADFLIRFTGNVDAAIDAFFAQPNP